MSGEVETIIGAVDGFIPPNQLVGWAKVVGAAVTCELELILTCDSRILARTHNTDPDVIEGRHRAGHFNLTVQDGLSARDLVYGRLQVFARHGATDSAIPFYSPMIEAWKPKAIVEELQSLDKVRLAAVLEQIRPLATDQMQDADLLSTLRRWAVGAKDGLRFRLAECMAYLATETSDLMFPAAPKNEISFVGLPVGLKSANDITIVGREGFLFVLKGANDLYLQHQQDPTDETVLKKADIWSNIFSERQERLEACGCRYIQMIIPEKSSLLPELFPLSITHPTALLSRIEANIAANRRLSGSYIQCLDVLRTDQRREDVFRQLDSHMGVHGNRLLFMEILKWLGHPDELVVDLTRHPVYPSDLGANFPGVPLRERLALPSADQFSTQAAGLVRLEEYIPADGKHVGSRFVWANSTSILPLRVVAFGNSFFERGGNAACLSWWAARWFREFHFLWYPNTDYDYVDRVKPDIVICQTIERFLPVPPLS